MEKEKWEEDYNSYINFFLCSRVLYNAVFYKICTKEILHIYSILTCHASNNILRYNWKTYKKCKSRATVVRRIFGEQLFLVGFYD